MRMWELDAQIEGGYPLCKESVSDGIPNFVNTSIDVGEIFVILQKVESSYAFGSRESDMKFYCWEVYLPARGCKKWINRADDLDFVYENSKKI